jgi:hypothetical protein
MYAGNHSLCHPLMTMLQAAKRLRAESEIQFVFVGGGARVVEVSDFKRENQLENVLQFEYQDSSVVDAMLSAADVHVVAMGEPFVGIVHPSKVYRILQAERPFVYVGPTESAIGQLLQAEQLDWQCDHDDVERFIAVLYAFRAASQDQRSEMRACCGDLAKRYRRRPLVDALISAIGVTPSNSSIRENP